MRHLQLNDGKYTLVYDPEMHNGNGGFAAPLRHGEHWPAYDSNPMCNLECAMAHRIMELEDELARHPTASLGDVHATERLGDIQLSDLEMDLV
jgi:hypothetical protein